MNKDDIESAASGPGAGLGRPEAEYLFSEDAALDRMLLNVVGEVKQYADIQISHIRKLSEIGIALSYEKNIERLLEQILDEARLLAGADAGTLYMTNDTNGCLEFSIVQNDTMKTRMGGTSGPITWPPVQLEKDGEPNYSNVSSYSAITGKIVNIPDVYEAEGFDFTGTRKFDSGTGYRSRSMLVIPMKNKDNETIGVLQLINALDPDTRNPIPFKSHEVDIIASLASQAAVAITNVRLYQDLENLFDSFIQTIASAIDEKSPYTAGHIRRVQGLTMLIAGTMNSKTEGPFRDFNLNADEMKELSLAAWLHDIGKITTPEHVVDKSTKLEKVFDISELIRMRYEVMKREIKLQYFNDKIEHCQPSPSGEESPVITEEEYKLQINELDEEEKFILNCNQPGEFMDEAKLQRLKLIAAKRWDNEGQTIPYLTEDELYNLSIKKGSLNNEERKIIENHALVSYKMLNKLPFPKKLRRVPEFAGEHHEKLDGTGYPFGRKGEELSLQTRIIALADVFEALTAPDRPYKKPMNLSQALKILDFMKKDKHLDADILDLFIGDKIYEDYAKRELKPEQLDCI
jgi:HD-GYP domain-containing protein (c-di-GMP phosphodiesterase class II)